MVAPEQVTVAKVEQEIYHVGRSEKVGLLLGILRSEPQGRFLVFCNTRAAAEKVEAQLKANGYKAASITGDIPQEKRMKVLSRFKDGTLSILVATDVASRGLHIEGVTHVINYDLPQDPEDYVHRIGRTARAGAGGRAISLACEKYVHSLPDIEEYIRQKLPVMPISEDMIVTGYRRTSGVSAEKRTHSQGRGLGSAGSKDRRPRTGKPSHTSEKSGRRPERSRTPQRDR